LPNTTPKKRVVAYLQICAGSIDEPEGKQVRRCPCLARATRLAPS
jgi:hypothetical protein